MNRPEPYIFTPLLSLNSPSGEHSPTGQGFRPARGISKPVKAVIPVGAPGAGLPILAALNRLGKPVYEGTVPFHVKQRRREQSKRAKRSRRANRNSR